VRALEWWAFTQGAQPKGNDMTGNSIFYVIGVIVVIALVLAFLF